MALRAFLAGNSMTRILFDGYSRLSRRTCTICQVGTVECCQLCTRGSHDLDERAVEAMRCSDGQAHTA